MTANEARRKLDLPDGEGGDALLANGNVIKLTQAGAAYDQPVEETEPAARDPDETEEEERGDEQDAEI